ncbi:hypothetical protein WMO27_16205 [Lachnospiraceae bacterium CLA-AA-H183]
MEHWSFASVFDHSGGQYGEMWEWDGICGGCLNLTVSLMTADCNMFRV